jgi:hypothetical protein
MFFFSLKEIFSDMDDAFFSVCICSFKIGRSSCEGFVGCLVCYLFD